MNRLVWLYDSKKGAVRSIASRMGGGESEAVDIYPRSADAGPGSVRMHIGDHILGEPAPNANRRSNTVLPAHVCVASHPGQRGPHGTLRSQSLLDRIAPENGPYEHNSEGADGMPAHLKTALTHVQLSIPLVSGKLALGTWQGIYVFERRRHPH